MSAVKTRIMYIERKAEGLSGPVRVGRVTLSKSGRSVSYGGQTFLRVGNGYKYNHIDVEDGAAYWISGPRKDGRDRLYGGLTQPGDVDEDVATEYWTKIRGRPRPR